MKFMNRRVALSVALLLLCALVLPYLVACSDKKEEEKQPEKVEQKKESVDEYIPVIGGDEVDSLASTPNKGDGTTIVSGGDGVKSAYSQTLEDLENALKNASTTQAQIISMRRDAAEQYMTEKALTSGFVLGGTGALADESVVDVFELGSSDEIILR